MANAMDEYFEKPWAILKTQQNKDWWLAMYDDNEQQLPKRQDFPIVRLVRARIHSLELPLDLWVLRIVFGNHQLVALHSIPLLLYRARGICQRQPHEIHETTPERGLSASPLPSRTPSRGSSPEPTSSPAGLKKGSSILARPFADNSAPMVESHEYFELEDSDDTTDERLAQMACIVDLIELLRFALVYGPPDYFRLALYFVFDLIERPDGRWQRARMQPIVMRCCGIIAYFLVSNPYLTRQYAVERMEGSMERVYGCIARVAYYQPAARLVGWLRDNVRDASEESLLIARQELTSMWGEEGNVPQIKIGSSREYESIYRRLCLSPHLVLPLETEILERLEAGETDQHFIAIVMTLAYHRVASFERLVSSVAKWKAKMRVKDQRVDVFLQAAAIATSV